MELVEYVKKSSAWKKWEKANEEACTVLTALESGKKDIDTLVETTHLTRKVISHRLNHLRRKGLVKHVEYWEIRE